MPSWAPTVSPSRSPASGSPGESDATTPSSTKNGSLTDLEPDDGTRRTPERRVDTGSPSPRRRALGGSPRVWTCAHRDLLGSGHVYRRDAFPAARGGAEHVERPLVGRHGTALGAVDAKPRPRGEPRDENEGADRDAHDQDVTPPASPCIRTIQTAPPPAAQDSYQMFMFSARRGAQGRPGSETGAGFPGHDRTTPDRRPPSQRRCPGRPRPLPVRRARCSRSQRGT